MPDEPDAPFEERSPPYDPVEWSRRLDKAREARARILAARRGAADAAESVPYRLHSPLALQAAEAAAPCATSSGTRQDRARASIPRVAGFLFGLAAAALVGHLILLATGLG